MKHRDYSSELSELAYRQRRVFAKEFAQMQFDDSRENDETLLNHVVEQLFEQESSIC